MSFNQMDNEVTHDLLLAILEELRALNSEDHKKLISMQLVLAEKAQRHMEEHERTEAIHAMHCKICAAAKPGSIIEEHEHIPYEEIKQ